MSEIKVSCPECKNPVHLDTEVLNKTKGRALCPSCGFVFHLVKKAKKKPEPTEKPRPEAPEPTPRRESARTPRPNDALMFEEVDDNPPLIKSVDDSLKNMFDDFADLDDDGVKTPPPKSAKTKPRNSLHKTVSELSSLKTQQQPLSYRVPKAQMFADANAAQGQPFTFTLLDRDSISAQLPQVAIKEKNANSGVPSEIRQDGQQNNITIHTDSLVFTLLGDGQSTTSMNTSQPNTATQTATQTQTQTVTASSEMNWTIATLSALIVLIVQLFYWVMMMM